MTKKGFLILFLFIVIMAIIACNDDKSAKEYYNSGLKSYNEGAFDQAIISYNKCIEINPNVAFAYTNRGMAWFRKGNYKKAIYDFEKSLDINPTDTLTYNNLGMVYYNKGDNKKALMYYEQALQINSNDRIAIYNRNIILKGSSYEEGIKAFTKALEENQNDSSAYYERAMLQLKIGDFKKAAMDLQKAIQLSPEKNKYKNALKKLEYRK
jgi:tetratricopeptide (TPR) repeat protein